MIVPTKPTPEQTIEALGGCLIALAFLPVGMVTTLPLRVWVWMKLWAWFIVPGFGAPPLTWHSSAGIVLLLSLATIAITSNAKKDDTPITVRYEVSRIVFSVITSLTSLGFGYLYHVITRAWG